MSRKVLFVAPSAYTLGGLATWLDYLIPGLAKIGWRPVLGLMAGRFHNVSKYVAAHPVPEWIAIPNFTGSHEGRIRNLCRAMHKVAPDIVIGVNIADTYQAVDRYRRENNRALRSIMSVHGIAANFADDVRRYQGILDAVICTNRLACRLMEKDSSMGIDRVMYAPYGVALPEISQRLVLKDSTVLRLAYVGRFDNFQKRVLDIPRILRELDRRSLQWSLVLAGSGPAEERLKEELCEWIVDGKVEFLGAISVKAVVEEVYGCVDALLLTSQWETGPLVIWEAMAHGVPVIASRYVGSGLEASLQHEQNCLLYPIGDAAQAAVCIQALVDRSLGERLAANARKMVEERYTHDASVSAWDSALQTVLSRPQLSPYRLEEPIPPAGRLDHWLGTAVGETVRRLMGRRGEHIEPGGEWPHTYTQLAEADPNFWKMAIEIDSRCARPANS